MKAVITFHAFTVGCLCPASLHKRCELVHTRYKFDRSFLRWIPLKLIVVLVAISGIALTALLAVSFERERLLMEAIGAREIRLQDLPDQTRFLLLVLAASTIRWV